MDYLFFQQVYEFELLKAGGGGRRIFTKQNDRLSWKYGWTFNVRSILENYTDDWYNPLWTPGDVFSE